MKLNLTFLIILFFLIVASRFVPNWVGVKNEPQSVVIGGIVPHHLYVRDIIGDFFTNLKSGAVDNIIILGPNHLEIGDSKITYYPDFDDQSLTALIPYVSNNFPTAKIIPIVLKRELSLSECRELAIELSKISGHNLLITSIDFSHYLSSDKAEKNDIESLAMIRNKDYESILKLNSDFMDSPPSLVTSLIYFESKGMTGIRILDNANSGRRGNPFAPTTSYFSAIVYAQN